MGGMTAAALLAKLGRRVLVLEQHYIPGGFTQTFKRPGYRWDVGVHLVGEMTEKSFNGRLLACLTDGRLHWNSLGDIYDEFNFPENFTIQFPSSVDGFRENLIDAFPSERHAIDEYLQAVRRAARASSAFFQTRNLPRLLAPGAARKARQSALPHIGATTAEVLAALTDDPHLRSVLAAQWGYYGSTPSRSSFAMHALMVAHFLRGAYYPVGGAGSIATTMLATVAVAGGWTAVRTPVAGITVSKGRVTGVALEDGTEIGAAKVISAVGAPMTARLLGNEEGFRLPDGVPPGPAHVSLYLGFEGDVEDAGGSKYCQWFFDSWDMEIDRWDVEPGIQPGPAPVLFNSFPSLKDPAHDPGPELRHTGEAITFVPWEPFQPWAGTRWQKRGPEYESFKETLTAALLDQYRDRYPKLAPMIRHAELSTPVSTYHFARSEQGSIYGLASEPERFLTDDLRAKSAIRNLYLAGADAMAPGVAGAMGGGLLAAAATEPVRTLRFLRPLMAG